MLRPYGLLQALGFQLASSSQTMVLLHGKCQSQDASGIPDKYTDYQEVAVGIGMAPIN
jgi:hypothetical protein